jgi:DNA-binding Lrp family transcriptional regulator
MRNICCVFCPFAAVCCDLLAAEEKLVDVIDRQVVGCLLRDGRATFAEIGAQVGLSAPAAKRRVDRLVASGAIRGFTAVIDPSALGWTTEAYVELYCRGIVAPQELQRSLEQVPEVVSACTVSGSADALLHMLATDISHLEQAIERIRREPNVDHTESVIVLSRLIDRR